VRLFIGNLPFQANEEEIQGMFEAAGATVDAIQVMRDKFTGKSRGFGFADIKDDAQANAVIQACNGRNLLGRALVVNEARPSTPGGGGGGGYRGDRGGDRGDRGGWRGGRDR
jgi:RNA recognition motif-containing protein